MNSIFDVIGPVMIGPSSSHTAGAARLARMARLIFKKTPDRVDMTLYGSFAKTYKGHGTDKALLGGLLGYMEDDEHIRVSDELAHRSGMAYRFIESPHEMGHPNVVKFDMYDIHGRHVCVIGRSLGGGRILVTEIDGMDVAITGDEFTIVVLHKDRPGSVSVVSQILGNAQINISGMRVFRKIKHQDAVMLIMTDSVVDDETIHHIKQQEGIQDVLTFPVL